MELPTHVPLTPQWYATSSRVPSQPWQTSSVSHLPVLLTVCGVAAGSVGDHATLLCSLLLGFYLDAYVAVGTSIDAAGQESFYVWVMTRGRGRVVDAHHALPLSLSHTLFSTVPRPRQCCSVLGARDRASLCTWRHNTAWASILSSTCVLSWVRHVSSPCPHSSPLSPTGGLCLQPRVVLCQSAAQRCSRLLPL